MSSLTWWTWVWVNSGSWWWTRSPGGLLSMGSHRFGHNWCVLAAAACFIDMPKPLTVWITINCGQFWRRWEYQTTWPASWETCMQVRKQQLELAMEHLQIISCIFDHRSTDDEKDQAVIGNQVDQDLLPDQWGCFSLRWATRTVRPAVRAVQWSACSASWEELVTLFVTVLVVRAWWDPWEKKEAVCLPQAWCESPERHHQHFLADSPLLSGHRLHFCLSEILNRALY